MRILWNPAPSAECDVYQLLQVEYSFRTKLIRHLLQLKHDTDLGEDSSEFSFLFNPETRKFILDSNHPQWIECLKTLSGIEELQEFF